MCKIYIIGSRASKELEKYDSLRQRVFHTVIQKLKETSERKVKEFTLMFSQEDMQFVMYICTNSVGRSTAVVSLFTTSIECRLISILTRTVK